MLQKRVGQCDDCGERTLRSTPGCPPSVSSERFLVCVCLEESAAAEFGMTVSQQPCRAGRNRLGESSPVGGSVPGRWRCGLLCPPWREHWDWLPAPLCEDSGTMGRQGVLLKFLFLSPRRETSSAHGNRLGCFYFAFRVIILDFNFVSPLLPLTCSLRNLISDSMKAKITAYVILLALHINDFQIDLTMLQRDLKLSERR